MRLSNSFFALCLATGTTLAAQGAPPYLGQPLPGPVAVPFAPGIVNCGLPTRDLTFSPDGRAIYIGIFMPSFSKAVILEAHQDGDHWTELEVAPFSQDPRWKCMEACVSPDGERFFFVSDRPADPKAEKAGPFGIWVMVRKGNGWGEPTRLPESVNGGGNAFYPSLTVDGTLYFLREEGRGGWLMRATWKNGAWSQAEKLPAPFNANSQQANPRVDPGGRFILVPLMGRPDSLGGADYYGYFRREDGSWTEPLHLGPAVNSAAADEFSINLSPDGKFLFFGSDRRIPRLDAKPLRLKDLLAERSLPGNGMTTLWWVDAGFLAEARKKALGAHP